MNLRRKHKHKTPTEINVCRAAKEEGPSHILYEAIFKFSTRCVIAEYWRCCIWISVSYWWPHPSQTQQFFNFSDNFSWLLSHGLIPRALSVFRQTSLPRSAFLCISVGDLFADSSGFSPAGFNHICIIFSNQIFSSLFPFQRSILCPPPLPKASSAHNKSHSDFRQIVIIVDNVNTWLPPPQVVLGAIPLCFGVCRGIKSSNSEQAQRWCVPLLISPVIWTRSASA